ncbi:TonB-dependent receptor [Novosphingobium endophyticum]|uniref:TonB-dependent receptor n=2 Tax=Novosphingobium endophyticum TaxID=1955250 RepID=A0A916TU71_9SPHN|nr:TonB-dependent receptor [Novosphingobium endophyticum]
MRSRLGIHLLIGSARIALAGCALSPSVAWAAQEEADPVAEPAADNRVGEIVVTARKKVESLQDVPTAVTALGAAQLKDLQIESFQDVGKTVPNVLVQKQAGSPTAPQFNIRGISAGSLNFQIDSGVALYIDGVYLGRPGNSGFDLVDLERLEVLRGPQGTLFGRNSTGGAISFITAGPTGEFGVIAEATVGNYDRRRGRITINTPEWAGLSARITYVHDEQEGPVKNSADVRRTFLYPEPFGPRTAAKTFGANNTDSVLAAVRYEGIPGLTLDYKFDYTDLVTTIDGMQLLVGSWPDQPALGGTNVSGLEWRDELPIDGIAPSQQETWGHSLTGVYELNEGLDLKYIGAVRGFDVKTTSELDGNALVDPAGSGNPYQYLAAARYAKQKQWSHELQLLGETSAFDWVAGLFYFREKAELNSPVIFGLVSPPGEEISITNPGSYLAGGALQEVLNRSFAAFAHGNLRLGESLELGAGLRYSRDKRSENDLLDAPRPEAPRGKYTAKQNRVDYDATLKYEFADNSNVYAKFATGYVSGGIFNSVEFEPETVKSYELGIKTEFLDRRVRINAALFQADRKNLQKSGFLVGVGNILINSGSATDRGVELEATVVPTDGLTLTANYGFVDTDMSTGVRSYQPRHSGYVAAEYEFPEFDNGMRPSFRIDGQYIGKHYRLICPYGSQVSTEVGCAGLENADFEIDRALTIPSRLQVGARLSLADIPLGGASGRVSLWGKNLTNNHEFEYLFSIGSRVLGTFQMPRSFGVDFGVQF